MITRRVAAFLVVLNIWFVAYGHGQRPAAPPQGTKEKIMPVEWMTKQLAQHGYKLVLFQYENVQQDALPEGPKAAAGSFRQWQEQLMTREFLIPGAAKTGIHHRRRDEPDSLSFEYPVAGYIVRYSIKRICWQSRCMRPTESKQCAARKNPSTTPRAGWLARSSIRL